MLFSRARTAIAGAVVTSALVLGATTAVQAGPADNPAEQTTQLARTAPAHKLAAAKKKTIRLAEKKQAKYRKVRAFINQNKAEIPTEVRTTVNKRSAKRIDRLDRLAVNVANAQKLKRVKALRAKIKADRPAKVRKVAVLAQRATQAAATGNSGLLESILDDLLGLGLKDTVLGPVIGVVDSLLNALTGGVGTSILTDLLDQLLGLLNGLLGGRLLGA